MENVIKNSLVIDKEIDKDNDIRVKAYIEIDGTFKIIFLIHDLIIKVIISNDKVNYDGTIIRVNKIINNGYYKIQEFLLLDLYSIIEEPSNSEFRYNYIAINKITKVRKLIGWCSFCEKENLDEFRKMIKIKFLYKCLEQILIEYFGN